MRQLITCKSGILSNSLVFAVTKINLFDNAVAPIKTSYAPIGVPFFFKKALILAVKSASFLVKLKIVIWVKNSSIIGRIFPAFCGLRNKP